MAASLERFAVSDDGFTLPVEDVLTGRGFVTGKSGSGKSNTASVIMEELLDRNLGLLIVDTDGEYFGLTEAYDVLHVGKGSECDLELSSDDAKGIVPHALEDQTPILLDLSTYPTEEETEAVLRAVVDTLFVAEHDYRLPFLIILEEAHEFLPQSGGGNSDLKALLVRVAKRGRKRGLGICCLSQRPAAVDKEYITQCDWFVWHRLTWENDTDVVGRIMGSDAAEAVQSLDAGEAIVMTDWDESTERVQFRRKRTADAGATPSLEDLDLSRPASGSGRRRENVPPPADSSAPVEDSTGAGDVVTATDEGSDELTATADANEAGSVTSAEPESRARATPGRGSNDATLVTYDESADPYESDPFAGTKPSLERRRERHKPPEDAADPVWEVGAMIVYLYDTVVWYHALVAYRLERAIARAIRRVDAVAVGRPRPRRPGRYERFAYRLAAIAALVGLYALALFAAVRLA
ncbi:helicase HerA domain-containing protein [Natrialbaceae archaeon GCM10025810]|uniref:helicase HerA domain-containing protein n=1 Tax=Halovalidus salilacus TaxID=3075124 RepID=UPI0036113221